MKTLVIAAALTGASLVVWWNGPAPSGAPKDQVSEPMRSPHPRAARPVDLNQAQHISTAGAPTGTCAANCDGSVTPPTLNVADFACFLRLYAAADLRANCDGSTVAPVLNVNDFSCFMARFAAGCS